MKADWRKIYKNNFFSGNYAHFATPRTELDAKRQALVKTWRRAERGITLIEQISNREVI